MSLFNFYIIYKYIKGREQHLFNITAKISFWGVFLATCLLIIIMSIFNGFQNQIKKSIFDFDPHILISNPLGDAKIINWKKHVNVLSQLYEKEIESIGGMIQTPAIIKFFREVDHVFIRGESLQEDTNGWLFPKNFPKTIEPKNLTHIPKGNYCLIGKEMSINLNINIGDTISLVVPKGKFSLELGVIPNSKDYKVIGFFKTGHYHYDSKFVFISLESAQSLFSIDNAVQSIFIRLNNIDTLKEFSYKILNNLPFNSNILTIEDEQRNFFSALKLEKTIMFIILSLFIIVAMIGIIASIFNMIRYRKNEIGILKAIGVSRTDILFIFTFIGFIMGVVGTILGILLGITITIHLQTIVLFIEVMINYIGSLIAHYQKEMWYPVELLSKNTYYFDSLPIYFDLTAIYIVSICSMILSGIASFIPAFYASKLETIDIIRLRS